MIRKLLHKILGIDKVITQLNGRVTLIENIVGINSFMANEGNVGNVGSGNVGTGNVGTGNVGVGSAAPTGTTETEPDTSVDGGQSSPVGDGNVGDGNVGIGSA